MPARGCHDGEDVRRELSRSCCLGTGKAKQQEQKKLRSSSKAGKNTVPTEDTQVEESTEQHAKRAKATEKPAAATKRKSKVMTVKERKSLLEFLEMTWYLLKLLKTI